MKTRLTSIGMATLACAALVYGCVHWNANAARTPPTKGNPDPQVCRTRHALARAEGGMCPGLDGLSAKWRRVTVGPSDNDRAPAKDDNAKDKTLPPERLAIDERTTGYCAYEWAGKGEPARTDFGNALEPDCPAIATLAQIPRDWVPSDIPSGDWSSIALETERRARGVDAKDEKQPWWAMPKPKAPVRIEVVDTTPKAVTFADRSRHGYGVTRTIASVLCADPTHCAYPITAQIAMPMWSEEEPPHWNEGGFFGDFNQLANALRRALADAKPDERTIINLSLGWDPVKMDADSLGVLIVKTLLEEASCRGVLVIASAGNLTGTQGPLLPGGWEVDPAPDAAVCKRLGVERAASGAGKYRPLVYAVGATDGHDRRAAIMRPWGQPRLSAYGEMVAGMFKDEPAAPHPQSVPMSGTSMATAIVTAVAAAVWGQAPQLGLHEVMDVLYAGGAKLDPGQAGLGARPEFCLGETMGPCSPPEVRRVSLCNALTRAASTYHLSLDLACKDAAPGHGVIDKPKPPSATPPTTPTYTRCRTQNCGLPVGARASDFFTAVGPQDGVPYCPTCKLSKNLFFSLGVIGGTPNALPPNLQTTIVNTFRPSIVTSYQVTNPTAAGTYWSQWIPAPADVTAATLNWFYNIGVIVTDSELVQVQ